MKWCDDDGRSYVNEYDKEDDIIDDGNNNIIILFKTIIF